MINASLFKNTRKETANQPDFTGPGSVTSENLKAIFDAVQAGDVQHDDRGAIKIRVAGWKRTSASGTSYISMSIQLDRPKPAEPATTATTIAEDDLF